MPAFSNGCKQAARVLIRKKVARLLLLLPLLLLASPSHADEPLTNNELDQQFNQLSAFVRKQMSEKAVPGVAVGVLHSGQFKTVGFGISNVDNPQLVTPDTLFQIGSITKTMTGTVIMRLAEQGKSLTSLIMLEGTKSGNRQVRTCLQHRHYRVTDA